MKYHQYCLLLTLFIFSSFVTAEDKKTTGTITQLVAGDTACYVDFIDEHGQPFTELADFAICEQTDLIGQRVHIKYEEANVMAASCEGNPDCPDSETVLLVIDVQPVTGK